MKKNYKHCCRRMEGYWMKEKATSRGRMSSEKKLGT